MLSFFFLWFVIFRFLVSFDALRTLSSGVSMQILYGLLSCVSSFKGNSFKVLVLSLEWIETAIYKKFSFKFKYSVKVLQNKTNSEIRPCWKCVYGSYMSDLTRHIIFSTFFTSFKLFFLLGNIFSISSNIWDMFEVFYHITYILKIYPPLSWVYSLQRNIVYCAIYNSPIDAALKYLQ